MVMLGLEPHPGTHTVVALDLNGSLLTSLTVLNMAAGVAQLQHFDCQFSLTAMGHRSSRESLYHWLCETLLATGEAVHSICPNLTSQYRSRRGRRQNDILDAINVARALLANPEFQVLQNLDSHRELQELSRAQRRLSEQLKSSRGALKELTEDSLSR